MKQNLITIGRLTDRGYAAEFTKNCLKVRKGSMTVAVGERENRRLYKLNCRVVPDEYAVVPGYAAEGGAQTIEVWHERMGHANYQAIEQALKKRAIEGMEIEDETAGQRSACEPRILGKQARLPLPPSEKRATRCGELIHFDTVGPMSVESHGGCRWLAVFVEDFSGYLMVYPMRKKDGIYDAVQSVLVEAAAAGHRLRALRSDDAAEYRSSKIASILNQRLVKQEFSTPFVAAQNGRAERQNRTVMETARTMLEFSKLRAL